MNSHYAVVTAHVCLHCLESYTHAFFNSQVKKVRDEQGQKCPVVVEGRESDDWVVVHLGEDGATPPLGDTATRVQTVAL